ncbi:MAG: hypothetical protein L3J37_03110 [Rhodobacteraceae bacterium]|nr:hypothetical protein [Paracoccaceae bacterium]
MIPPIHTSTLHRRPDYEPFPDWFIRDMGERIHEITPLKRWRLPIWPGFRLELKITSVKGAGHV